MMDLDDDFSSISLTFVQWLKSSGAVISDKISLADLRQNDAGRGVGIFFLYTIHPCRTSANNRAVATTDVEADESLFSIPRNLILSVQSSEFASQYPDAFARVAGEPWLELILVMLYEHGKGDGSSWKAYFDVLPPAGTFDTLMYWDEAELQELEASAVVHKVGRAKADKTFRERIWPIVQAQPTVFGCGNSVQEEDVLQVAHRMGSLIMAYAFDIESEREREIDEEGYVSDEEDADLPKGMVPLADMLNANADRDNARLFYEPDALVMKAVKPISRGEEIFNDYGPLPRSDLLRRYGYITDDYALYDVVELSSDLILERAKAVLKLDDQELERRVSLKSITEALSLIVSAFPP